MFKKTFLITLISILCVSGSAFAEYPFYNEFKGDHSWAGSVKEILNDLVMQIDYDGGDNPIYLGYARKGSSTSEGVWIIYKFTYSGDQVTARETAFGAWTGRAGLTYN